ncbi:MAG: hypothetical protein K9I48_05235 [Sphingobacteriales bacterium]|nr:hypothetical protein [Sphingobacteriales bacterium]
MKYFKLPLFLLLSISTVLIACDEGPVEPKDKELPVITKILPAIIHQEYNFGDTAFFKINISDNHQLADVSLRLNLATDETVLFTQQFPDSSHASIDTFIIMNDTRFSDLDFTIRAVDASGNVALQSSHIHLN